MKHRVFGKLLLAATLVFGAVHAQAAATISFQMGPNGGTISWAGGSSPLIGIDIPIGIAIGQGTPLNNGSSLTVNGLLNFMTGNYQFTDVNGLLNFGGGGSMSITGDIATLGITNASLLSGSFQGVNVNTIAGILGLATAFGSDTKNPALISYFFGGNPLLGWSFNGTIFGIGTVGTDPNGNVTGLGLTPLSVSIMNTTVPEPGSVFLLGTAMVGISVLMRRRRRKSKQV
jgi:hypothetical protein